jgi:acyl-CoA reductase-like NAD-dependent aldehyde dehydrogenase
MDGFQTSMEYLISYNPTTGETIAAIMKATSGPYNKVVQHACDAFETW